MTTDTLPKGEAGDHLAGQTSAHGIPRCRNESNEHGHMLGLFATQQVGQPVLPEELTADRAATCRSIGLQRMAIPRHDCCMLVATAKPLQKITSQQMGCDT